MYGADWSCKAPIKLVHASYAKSKQQPDEEVVVLSKVLAADINLGYQDTGNIQVLSVNGTKVGGCCSWSCGCVQAVDLYCCLMGPNM